MILKLSIQESLSGVTCLERGAHREDPGQLYRRMVGEPGGKRLNQAALNDPSSSQIFNSQTSSPSLLHLPRRLPGCHGVKTSHGDLLGH